MNSCSGVSVVSAFLPYDLIRTVFGQDQYVPIIDCESLTQETLILHTYTIYDIAKIDKSYYVLISIISLHVPIPPPSPYVSLHWIRSPA